MDPQDCGWQLVPGWLGLTGSLSALLCSFIQGLTGAEIVAFCQASLRSAGLHIGKKVQSSKALNYYNLTASVLLPK